MPTVVDEVLRDMAARRPELADFAPVLVQAYEALAGTYERGGQLLLCGNGGSFADAMHIAGELEKSFERRRPLPPELAGRLQSLPFGAELSQHLEAGLPAVTLGLNGSLRTAVENDSPLRDMAFAQETMAKARPGDTLIAISTSGNADNCLMAMSVAKAVGATVVSLTGPAGGAMARLADIAVRAPGGSTKEVQEGHVVLYHTLCAMVEAHFFPEQR